MTGDRRFRVAPLAVPALAAVQFLTRIPVVLPGLEARDLARSLVCFPAVGALVGLTSGLVAQASGVLVPPAVAMLIAIIWGVLLTGGLHEDGLADAADGLGSGRPRDDILRIMRDSRVGSFGAIALILAFALRMALYLQIGIEALVPALAVACACSRWTGVVLMRALPDARTHGLAAMYGDAVCWRHLAGSTAMATAIAWGIAGEQGALMLGIAAAVAALSGWYYMRRIGGATGDCLGATIVISELAALLGFVALSPAMVTA